MTPRRRPGGIPNGRLVRIAGSVIVRQRPGTAKGFVFLSMEDETGIMNAIVTPDTFDRYKFAVLGEPFLFIDGVLQNQDGVVSVKAASVEALRRGRRAGIARFSLGPTAAIQRRKKESALSSGFESQPQSHCSGDGDKRGKPGIAA